MDKSQQNIILKFSAFPQLQDVKDEKWLKIQWRIKQELAKNMEQLLLQGINCTEEKWALIFIDELNQLPEATSPYIPKHLSAYLHRFCEKVAFRLNYQWKTVIAFKELYTIQDYFQIASMIASYPISFFKNYQLNQNFSLAICIQKRLELKTRDEIYRFAHLRLLKYKGLSLLRNASQKEIKAILKAEFKGDQEKINQYFKVWKIVKYNKEIKFSLTDFESDQANLLTKVSELYNEETNFQLTKTEILTILQSCLELLTERRTFRMIHPDQQISQAENEQTNSWDHYSYLSENYTLNRDKTLEQSPDYEKIGHLLNQALNQLNPEQLTIFRLYFGLNLTQTQLAQVFQVNQTTIGRKLNKAKRILLQQLSQLIQSEFKITLGNDTLAQIQQSSEELLTQKFKIWLSNLVQEIEVKELSKLTNDVRLTNINDLLQYQRELQASLEHLPFSLLSATEERKIINQYQRIMSQKLKINLKSWQILIQKQPILVNKIRDLILNYLLSQSNQSLANGV